MHRQVKICGLTRPQDVEAAIAYGADYLGFIVEAKSARKLSAAQAAKLSLPAKGAAKAVAVTVNADDDVIKAIAELMQPDYIQLHGDESPERAAKVTKRFGLKTIKAIGVSTPTDMMKAETYTGAVDFMLYDAKPPKGVTVRGGHGLSFDWTILQNSPLPKLWALAGGLTPENAAEAIRRTNAPILDVSSGVEASAGIKDAQKIEAFMKAAKGNYYNG